MPPVDSPAITDEELQKALEALLFITDRALSLDELSKLTGVKDKDRLSALIARIKAENEARGSAVQVLEIAEGFQMATQPVFAPFVRKLFSERMTMRLSTAAHETLSIVAYKQPITRAEIEEIRGVEVIAALETLLEKRLVRVVGRKETVGRPLMYGTTPEFLRHFGLRSLDDLPPIESFVPVESEPQREASQADSAPGQSVPMDVVTSVGDSSVEPSSEPAEETPGAGEQIPSEAADSSAETPEQPPQV